MRANEESEDGLYRLNIFGIDDRVEESEVAAFYKAIPATNVIKQFRGKVSIDVEFDSIKKLEEAIDLGSGELQGKPFFIRTSKYFLM